MHVKTYTSKLEDRAWEGRLVIYNPNSKAYRTFKGSTQRIVDCGAPLTPVCRIGSQRLFVAIVIEQN